MCWRDEEKLLVNNRQMMCVLGLVARKEWIVVMTGELLSLFVDKRRCVLENQNTVSIEAIMRGLARTSDYKLLKRQNEGYGRR